MLTVSAKTHQLYVWSPIEVMVAHAEESMQVVAMLQSKDVVGQQPPTHVPLIVVNRQESVTAQAYGDAGLILVSETLMGYLHSAPRLTYLSCPRGSHTHSLADL